MQQAPRDVIRLSLKYGTGRERVINGLQRISRPGLRIYTPKGEIPKCMGGLGLVILSTPKGIISGRQAKRLGMRRRSHGVRVVTTMSRIGRMPIDVPSGVKVGYDQRVVTVKGPKGELSLRCAEPIDVRSRWRRA